jgi:predicted O-methyltransferase YrrM
MFGNEKKNAEIAAILEMLTDMKRELTDTKREIGEIKARLENMDVFDYRNIYKIANHQGSVTSARHWQANMVGKPGFPHRDLLLAHSLDSVKVEGQWIEFGVADGGSITWMANRHPNAQWHGFDSFEGLPEAWAFNALHAFDRGGSLPPVPDNVTLHKGWYDDSVPPYFKENREPIAFIHMDCDIYSSTKCVLDNCWDLLQPGTIIQFDEYWNYAGWEEHEHKAWMECVTQRGLKWEYLGYTTIMEQVSVRLL